MANWLFKTEPNEFSIDDLVNKGAEGEVWEGIRNYQARNFLRDDVQLNDQVLIYHSSCKDVGVVGLAKVIETAFPDPFQFDPESKYYDPKSTKEAPRWVAVKIAIVEKFDALIPLKALKDHEGLASFQLVKRGNRLSIFPVANEHFNIIRAMS